MNGKGFPTVGRQIALVLEDYTERVSAARQLLPFGDRATPVL